MASDRFNYSMVDGIFSPDSVQPVTLIGAGSIGSHVAVMLSHLGFTQVEVWDDDQVESHNLPASIYGPSDLGGLKVEALANFTKTHGDVAIKPIPQRFTGQTRLRDIVIACVDSMAARKTIWASVVNNVLVPIYIETRVAATYIEVFALRPCSSADIATYKPFLAYGDNQTVTPLCGLHGSYFVSQITAGLVGAVLTRFLNLGTIKLVTRMNLAEPKEVTPPE